MNPEKEVKFFNLIRSFNRQKIRYLIIGRRAVILYGGPVLTADTVFWIHPEDKKKVLSSLLDKIGLEISDSPDTRRPIVSAFSGLKKYDFFSRRALEILKERQLSLMIVTKNQSLKRTPKKILVSESPLSMTSYDSKRLGNQM